MQELIKTTASATTLPILNKTAFSKLLIPIPPLEIQKQIVAILEKHFTSAVSMIPSEYCWEVLKRLDGLELESV